MEKFKIGDWVFGIRLGCIAYNDEKHAVQILKIEGNDFKYNLHSNKDVIGQYQKESGFYPIQQITRLATQSEIQKVTGIKEFVLSNSWHIIVTEENQDILSKWRYTHTDYKLPIDYITGMYLHPSGKITKEHNPANSRGNFGEEITFSQFKQYVLKEKVENKIKYEVGDIVECVSDIYI